jgi:hypothetical protein
VRKRIFQAAATFCIATAIVSCASQARIKRDGCAPSDHFVNVQNLVCTVTHDHLLQIGSARPPVIPEGTSITYIAKLANAGNHCATIKIREPIPPHLNIVITGQPVFEAGSVCKAWRKLPPVLEQ